MTQSESTPTVTYIHPDHLGSTAVETDDTGAVTKTLDYYTYDDALTDWKPLKF